MELGETKPSDSLEKEKERDLSGLYPRQKTYDELLEKRRKVTEFRLSLRPRFTLVTAGLVFSVIIGLLFNSISVVTWIAYLGGGLMGGTFFSFLFGLALFGLFIWQVKRVNSYFYDRALSSISFFCVYVFLAFTIAWLYRTLSNGEGSVGLSVMLCATLWIVMIIYGAVYVKIKSEE